MTVFLLVLGLACLTAGAELFVRGGSGLARSLGVSPLVVGLTFVAYGTSTPELVVSVGSAWEGQAVLALGNVVGSNVFNVLFILGSTACVAPLTVHQELVWWEVPLLIVISGGVFVLGLDGVLSPGEGILLLVVLVAYTTWALRTTSRASRASPRERDTRGLDDPVLPGRARSLLIATLGLGFLLLGSRWFSTAAAELARSLGVSEWVIGITIVAAGTSLPELGTSLLAAVRGKQDIAVGNVIGSNLFNLTGILGATVLTAGDPLPVAPFVRDFDLLVSVGVAVACLPVFWTGHRIDRWEGGLFLVYYVGYVLLSVYRPEVKLSTPAVTLLFLGPLLVSTGYVGYRRWRTL